MQKISNFLYCQIQLYEAGIFYVLPGIEEAIAEEKKLKKWNRDWKIKLISDNNPQWLDLFNEDL